MINEIVSKFISSAKNDETKALIADLLGPVYSVFRNAYLLILFVLLCNLICLVYVARAVTRSLA